LTTGRAKIKQSYDDLHARWQDLAEGWDDASRKSFEEEHLERIPPDLQAALRSIDRLSAVISQLLNDCG
jgi:hypothetical protein